MYEDGQESYENHKPQEKSWLNKMLDTKRNHKEPLILSLMCSHLRLKQSAQLSHKCESIFGYNITQACSHVRSPSLLSLLVSLELFKAHLRALSFPLRLMPQMASRLSHIVMLQCVNRRNYNDAQTHF